MWGPKGVKGRGMTGESWGLKGEGERCFNKSSTFTNFFLLFLRSTSSTFIKRRNWILHTFIPKACYCVSYFLIIVFVFTYILGRIHADDNNFQIHLLHFWYNCIITFLVAGVNPPTPFKQCCCAVSARRRPFLAGAGDEKTGDSAGFSSRLVGHEI